MQSACPIGNGLCEDDGLAHSPNRITIYTLIVVLRTSISGTTAEELAAQVCRNGSRSSAVPTETGSREPDSESCEKHAESFSNFYLACSAGPVSAGRTFEPGGEEALAIHG